MSGTVAALKFLKGGVPRKAPPVNVVFGDEPYLKKRVAKELIAAGLCGNDAQFGLSRLAAADAGWRDVVDDLSTASLFGDRRLVVVEDADALVSEYRKKIEGYVTKPTTDGMLVLTVTTWAKNTRLYKLVDEHGLQIECKRFSASQLVSWLQTEAKERFNLPLSGASASQMVEIVGCEMGMLDQELSKLALFANSGAPIGPEKIREVIGGWRAQTAWVMLDAACDGNAPEALRQLERLIHADEHPVAILAQVGAALRRFAAAARIYRDAKSQGRQMRLSDALEAAGVQHFLVKTAEPRLRRIGRDRAGDLYRWLLEADLAVKGESSKADRARLVLERLIVRIAVPQETLRHQSPSQPTLARLS